MYIPAEALPCNRRPVLKVPTLLRCPDSVYFYRHTQLGFALGGRFGPELLYFSFVSKTWQTECHTYGDNQCWTKDSFKLTDAFHSMPIHSPYRCDKQIVLGCG